jgi:DNA-binding NarL/FixJ family response regulator
MSKKLIRLAIVEDQQLLAQSLAAWVGKQKDLELVASASDGEEGWTMFQTMRPELMLVDIELPGLDGLELGRRVLEEEPRARVLAMSGMGDPYTLWRVRQSGVHGYVEKALGPDTLMDAIRIVANGGTYFSETFERSKSEWLAHPEAFYKVLSEREQDVLRQLVTGSDDQQIGGRLAISAATVGVHRKHIRQKLKLHNDRELLAYARRWGLDKPVAPPGWTR